MCTKPKVGWNGQDNRNRSGDLPSESRGNFPDYIHRLSKIQGLQVTQCKDLTLAASA